ncbi:MAG: HupE/UreJ family protein [Cyclobacteriaceae bacterium]|nr:HupE/UreJ family protein [Cyclobacteriaceae bacterium]
MSQFQLYFDLGLEHILDMAGFDHIVFIIILCAIYLVRDWKRILILVTAFTIGHTFTLALATLKVITVDTKLVEFLIPLTIFITAITNLFHKDSSIKPKRTNLNYYLAVFFGLVHGLGFSNNLRSLLGKEETIVTQLISFNIGIEIGQIAIVLLFLLSSFIFVDLLSVGRRDWKMIISSAGGGIAVMLMLQNKFW